MALYDRDLQISSHLVLHRALTFGVCIKPAHWILFR